MGNSSGDDELRSAALTYADEIKKSQDFDAERDEVIVQGVNTKGDWENAIMKANNDEDKHGKIEQVALFSHSGQINGPVFPGGKDTESRQYMHGTEDLSKLWFNW